MINFCKIGIHRWNRREIHVVNPIIDKLTINAVVIERCNCGASRVPPSGGIKNTQFIVPDRWVHEWVPEPGGE